jgi:ribosomal protein S27E
MSPREVRKSDWMCIECPTKLGDAYGGEFYPCVPGEFIHTSGPNLSVKCPQCGKTKIWYI